MNTSKYKDSMSIVYVYVSSISDAFMEVIQLRCHVVTQGALLKLQCECSLNILEEDKLEAVGPCLFSSALRTGKEHVIYALKC